MGMDTYTLSLTKEEVAYACSVLNREPFRDVALLLLKIQRQCEAQDQRAKAGEESPRA